MQANVFHWFLKVNLSLIPFNPWMFLLCVLVHRMVAKPLFQIDITSWHGFAFHLNVTFFNDLDRGSNAMNIGVKFMASNGNQRLHFLSECLGEIIRG